MILEPQDQEISAFFVVRKRRPTNFEAPNLRKGRSGSSSSISFPSLSIYVLLQRTRLFLIGVLSQSLSSRTNERECTGWATRTDSFTISEPQIQSMDEFYEGRKRRSMDLGD